MEDGTCKEFEGNICVSLKSFKETFRGNIVTLGEAVRGDLMKEKETDSK